MSDSKHPFKPSSTGLAYSTMRHLTNHREIEGKTLANDHGPMWDGYDRWRYDDPEDYVEQRSILTDARDDLLEATARHLERQLLGAWMADYDYLYVIDANDIGPTVYEPSNSTEPPYDPKLHHVERYDLRWLFPEDVREVRQSDD